MVSTEETLAELFDGTEPRDAEPVQVTVPFPTLTSRERQVATMLALGYTNRTIAADLGISIKTVDTHRGHILDKLNLTNNVGLARLAIREGYVSAVDTMDKQIDDQLATVKETDDADRA